MSKTISQISDFIHQAFPEANLEIKSIADTATVVHFPIEQKHLRPGGSVSGPTVFAAADASLYIAILGHLGPVIGAVTSGLSINFLNKAMGQTVIVATCQLLKVGKRQVVGEVKLVDERSQLLIAQATGTYSIPPGEGSG